MESPHKKKEEEVIPMVEATPEGGLEEVPVFEIETARGGRLRFWGSAAKLKRMHPGAKILRYADGRPYRGSQR